MGEVWRARRGMLARPAAVKLIRADQLLASSAAPDRSRPPRSCGHDLAADPLGATAALDSVRG